MFFTSILGALCLLALQVSAVTTELLRLDLMKRYNITNGNDLVHSEQARAANSKLGVLAHAFGVQPSSAEIKQGVMYVADVTVGANRQIYRLYVDTGSSNTWIGALTKYIRSPESSTQTKDAVFLRYGSGYLSGVEYTDWLTMGTGDFTIREQAIGVATRPQGEGLSDVVDGVLGIGPTALTRGTLFPDIASTIPTVTDNLFSRDIIGMKAASLSFAPADESRPAFGELAWGDYELSRDDQFTDPITFMPITNIYPASLYWGINGELCYGSLTPILGSAAGIIDSSTSLILVATDAFQRYQRATGGILDATTGLLRITSAQVDKLQSLFFTAGGRDFELTANAQIWPRKLNTVIGGTESSIYLIVNDLGSHSGEGLDFVLGQSFLERFFSVYDSANKRVGLATTPFTNATFN